MRSCIYEGRVRHRRFSPRKHSFNYSLFMLYIDLDELDRVFEESVLWSVDRKNLAQFRRSDYLGDPQVPLRSAVEQVVRERTGHGLTGPVCLLAHLRYFGYCFNPVSFYFCFDGAGKHIETIVAEVTNTPWGERHCYVLDESMNHGSADKKQYRFDKDFHVSPFMPMDFDYVWHFTTPGRQVGIHMDNLRDGTKHFDATMTLARREITASELRRVLIRFPLITVKVIAAIHWNALLLWLKGCPFHVHPARKGTARP